MTAERGRNDADRQAIAEPMKVVALFTQLKTGVAAPSIATAYSKDIDTAKQLLATVPFAEMPGFIRYALAEAERTRFCDSVHRDSCSTRRAIVVDRARRVLASAGRAWALGR